MERMARDESISIEKAYKLFIVRTRDATMDARMSAKHKDIR